MNKQSTKYQIQSQNKNRQNQTKNMPMSLPYSSRTRSEILHVNNINILYNYYKNSNKMK